MASPRRRPCAVSSSTVLNANESASETSCLNPTVFLVPKSYRIPTFLEELEASVAPNGTVALECKVIGVPTPRLVWFKDEKELQTGDSYELKAENNKPTTTYKCVAINCVGSAMSETVLKIKKGENQASCTTQKT